MNDHSAVTLKSWRMDQMNTCFTFDLEGTITKQELLPLIASVLGLEKEMRLLTNLTIAGTIPFEDSFRLRCACLRAAPIAEVREIVASVEIEPNIEAFIQRHREQCAVITGNLDIWIEPLVRRLGCAAYSSTAVVENGQLVSITSVLKKNHPVLELRKTFNRIVAIGAGLNDMPMFDVADVCVAFGDVHMLARPLVEMADYVTFSGGALCRLLNTL
jgi:HAD superfamily phosphoserine phosphatase-like hydrolase